VKRQLPRPSAGEIAFGIGERGENVPGPPWIVGLRGSPLEAPENTRSGLARALALGLDGIAYDVRTCRGGEHVLVRDASLERTTDGHGAVAERTWRELAELDAGSWFGARFRGERVCLVEEALALAAPPERSAPQHVLLCAAGVDVNALHARAAELAPLASVRFASADTETCLDARDLGLAPLYLCERLGAREREFVRRERIGACAAPASEWRALGAEAAELDGERWVFGADSAEDLWWAARAPVAGVLTREPLRALAVRACAQLAPEGELAFPLTVPELALEPAPPASGRAAWWGSWRERARVTNPFGWSVRVTAGVLPRRGVFDVRGVPLAAELAPGATLDVPFELTGGAWSPGGDPVFWASYRWRAGPGRAAGRLLVDAALVRVRSASASDVTTRLELLAEGPRAEPATMLVRRRGSALLVSVETPGGLADVRTIVSVDGRVEHGARGVRARLPRDFDQRAAGVPFTCGFTGMRDGRRELRRWAGGLPLEDDAGSAGRLLAARAAHR
jgi:glycerophosphoryl diester phosphodiesterase